MEMKPNKKKYWIQLLRRAGLQDMIKDLPPPDIDDDKKPFEFNDDDWTEDLDQLEAIIEFYMNCNDPWKQSSNSPGDKGACIPILPGENGFTPVNLNDGKLHLVLIDCFGARNNSRGKILASGPKDKSVKIVKVDSKTATIELKLKAKQREKLKDFEASKIYFYLAKDKKRASKSYRIKSKAVKEQDGQILSVFTLDGKPSDVPADKPYPWEIIEVSAYLGGNRATIKGAQVTLNGGSLEEYRGNAIIQFPENDNSLAEYQFELIDRKKKIVKIYDFPYDLIKSPLNKWRIKQDEVWMSGKIKSVWRNKKGITLADNSGKKKVAKNIIKQINKNKDVILFAEDKLEYAIRSIIPKKSAIVLRSKPELKKGMQWQLKTEGVPLLEGTSATVLGTIVKLDRHSKILAKDGINAGFDTIYFQKDTSKKRHAYRIIDSHAKQSTIVVSGVPQIKDGSEWTIPSGIGGKLPRMGYRTQLLGPRRKTKGYDHYDGILFVVHKGEVKDRFRITSYTSRLRAGVARMSIRGNDDYGFFSSRAGKKVINYAFKISEKKTRGKANAARFYFDTPVKNNPPNRRSRNYGGTWNLFIHIGFKNGRSGSAGCNVSPQFYQLRDVLLDLYPDNATKAKLKGKGRGDSEKILKDSKKYEIQTEIYNNTDETVRKILGMAKPVKPDNYLSSGAWANKIKGTLWIIRPDERPLGS